MVLKLGANAHFPPRSLIVLQLYCCIHTFVSNALLFRTCTVFAMP